MNFWKMGAIYKHMGYQGRKWKLVAEEGEYVKLEALDGKAPYYLLTGKSVRPMFMYNAPQLW